MLITKIASLGERVTELDLDLILKEKDAMKFVRSCPDYCSNP